MVRLRMSISALATGVAGAAAAGTHLPFCLTQPAEQSLPIKPVGVHEIGGGGGGGGGGDQTRLRSTGWAW